jgi:putative ABC transport system substrate-binding protein
MRRRDFIYLLSSATVAAPLAARAQHPATPLIGVLSNSRLGASPHWIAALNRGLGDNGFVDGQNLTIDYRWADGSS